MPLVSFSPLVSDMLGRDPRRDGVFRTVERREIGGKCASGAYGVLPAIFYEQDNLLTK